MSMIRELTLSELGLVSGGGHYGDVRDAQGVGTRGKGAQHSLQRNAPNKIYNDPSTTECANAVFGGLVKGAMKGPASMAGNVAKAAPKCLGGNGSGGGGAVGGAGSNCSKGSCSSGSATGTCNR